MDINFTFVVSILAVIVMLYALVLAIKLKKHLSGGLVGRNWKFLIALVSIFAAGYIAMPFLGELSREVLQLVVGVIFLFGAIYVVITITLIRRIVEALSE